MKPCTKRGEKRSKTRRKHKQANGTTRRITQGQKDKHRRLRALVKVMLQEAINKHLTDVFEAGLNPDYHLSLTITVAELKEMAEIVGIKE